jgi:CubicO group peptidase (beta-lactamase class C family)
MISRPDPGRIGFMPLLPHTSLSIDQIVAEAQADGYAPCVAAAVVRDGVPAHVSGAGTVLGREADGASVADVQFRIGSITKTMTAVLVMQLRDEGRLSLADPLAGHLPGTPLGDEITLRHILGHASGLQREPDGDWWERVNGGDLDDLLSGLTSEKVALAPHEAYHYSNLAYGLLGAVLQKVTGQPWPDLVRQRILDPLGMSRTTFHPAEPYAPGYVVHPWLETVREEPRTDTGAMAPAGQLWSTPIDLLTWAAFLADPDPAVLAPESVREMCAPVVMSDLDTWSGGHGLGLELYRHGERVYIGHGGSMPGYLAMLVVHRPSRTGVVAYANAYTLRGKGIGPLAERIMATVLDSEPRRIEPWRPAAAEPEPEVLELLGRWWWMGREFELGRAGESGELVLRSLTHRRAPVRLRREGKDTWRGLSAENHGEIMKVLRDAAGTPVQLDFATFVFSRFPQSQSQ